MCQSLAEVKHLNLQVKEAFKRLSLQHHPDRVPENERKAAEERFQRISRAYSEAVQQYGKLLFFSFVPELVSL